VFDPLTVAKNGPEKKPRRLMATASVMMFGTLVMLMDERTNVSIGARDIQPEN
jgi:hypothetical protein